MLFWHTVRKLWEGFNLEWPACTHKQSGPYIVCNFQIWSDLWLFELWSCPKRLHQTWTWVQACLGIQSSHTEFIYTLWLDFPISAKVLELKNTVIKSHFFVRNARIIQENSALWLVKMVTKLTIQISLYIYAGWSILALLLHESLGILDCWSGCPHQTAWISRLIMSLYYLQMWLGSFFSQWLTCDILYKLHSRLWQ